MKFIKKYEGLLKRTDNKVINSPTIPLVNEIEEMLKMLAQLQGYDNWSVKKYYSDGYGDINTKIVYYVYNKSIYQNIDLLIVNIKSFMMYENTHYSLSIEAPDRSSCGSTKYKRVEIQDRVKKFMKKYIDSENYYYRGGTNEFTIDDIDDIINELKKITRDLVLELNANKYNL